MDELRSFSRRIIFWHIFSLIPFLVLFCPEIALKYTQKAKLYVNFQQESTFQKILFLVSIFSRFIRTFFRFIM
jgi:hypothetical protein